VAAATDVVGMGRDRAADDPRGRACRVAGAHMMDRRPQTADGRPQTTVQTGVGRHYREPSWLERLTDSMHLTRAPGWVRAPLKRAYETALRALPGDHLTCRLPGGEMFLVDPAHRHLAWNAEEYTALKACTHPGATVLDVGANVGAYTLLFADWVGARGHVYAFEPAAASRAGLARHVAINGLADRVTIRREAVSNTSGMRPFVELGTDGGNRIARPSDAHAIEVPAVSLDEFCGASRLLPDVIKIDVEGAELDVLRGARQTIARRGASLALFVELHPSMWPTIGISRAGIEAELRAQRLVIEPLDGAGDPWSTEGISVRVRNTS
jgi:FkbM family methyltransferase